MPTIREYDRQYDPTGQLRGPDANAADFDAVGGALKAGAVALSNWSERFKQKEEESQMSDATMRVAELQFQLQKSTLERNQEYTKDQTKIDENGNIVRRDLVEENVVDVRDSFNNLAQRYKSDAVKQYIAKQSIGTQSTVYGHSMEIQSRAAAIDAVQKHESMMQSYMNVVRTDPSQYGVVMDAVKGIIENGVGHYSNLDSSKRAELVDKMRNDLSFQATNSWIYRNPQEAAMTLDPRGYAFSISPYLEANKDAFAKAAANNGISVDEAINIVGSANINLSDSKTDPYQALNAIIKELKQDKDKGTVYPKKQKDVPGFISDLNDQSYDSAVRLAMSLGKQDHKADTYMFGRAVSDSLAEAERTGVPSTVISKDQFIGIYGEEAGAARHMDYLNLVKTFNVAYGLKNKNDEEIAASLEAQKPLKGTPGYSEKAKYYDMLVDQSEKIKKARHSDIVGYSREIKYGGKEIESVAGKTDLAEIARILAQRDATVRASSDQFEVPFRYFDGAEVQEQRAMVKQMTVNEQVQYFDTLVGGIKGEDFLQKQRNQEQFIREVAGDDVRIATAASFITMSKYDYVDILKKDEFQRTGKAIFNGRSILEGKDNVVAREYKKQRAGDVLKTFNESETVNAIVDAHSATPQGAQTGKAEIRNNFFNMVESYLVGNAATGEAGDYSQKKVTEAIKMVLGDVYTRGDVKMPVPRHLTKDEFEDSINRYIQKSNKEGRSLPAGWWLKPVIDGRPATYQIMDGAGPWIRDGKPVNLDFTKAVSLTNVPKSQREKVAPEVKPEKKPAGNLWPAETLPAKGGW